MKKTQLIRRSGFTLLELLVVLAIVVALFAILAPAVISYRNRTNVQTANTQIKRFEQALVAYTTERGAYPTTEQGLNALIYIPSGEASAMQPGMTTQPGMPGTDPNSAFSGGAAAVGGAEMLGGVQPGMTQPGMMNPSMGVPQPGMGATDPTMGMGMPSGMGQPGIMGAMPTDPAAMESPTAMGVGGAMGGVWTQPMFNPQLYVNARKRPDPFLDGDAVPQDPWKQPYRYDNTIVNGVNRYTGERKPAIWSAGPNGIDGDDDDIRNWDPIVANQQMMLQQQGVGTGMMNPNMGMGGMQPGMTDPNMGLGTPPGGMMQPGVNDPNMGLGTPPGGMTPPPTPQPAPPM